MTTTQTVDVLVVGNGLFGSATTRHLAERGHQVVCVGAAAVGPDVRTEVPTDWPSHQVYSSHNDAARLTRRQDRDPAWAEVTKRAIDNYRALEAKSGVSFFHDVGCLIASRPGGDGITSDPLAVMDATSVDYEYYAPGDRSWKQRWPSLELPESHYVAFEQSSAGYLQPKRLIEAQNVLASRAGARLVTDTVVNVRRTGGSHRVETASGAVFVAGHVVIAAGAFANFNDLLPSDIELRLKTEVIVLGEVSASDAVDLSRYPTVKYLNDPGDLDAMYMVAPLQYEDGRWYIKLGANTRLDETLHDLAGVQSWFATDTDQDYLPLYEPALRALWPTVDLLSVRTQPCVITYTSNAFPQIARVADGLSIATAGNGGGAKGSDAWGERTADLVEQHLDRR